MTPRRMKAESGVVVTFSYYDNDLDEQSVTFVVNNESVWSAEGLSRLFVETQAGYFGETPDADSEKARDTWHLTGVDYDADYFILEPRKE